MKFFLLTIVFFILLGCTYQFNYLTNNLSAKRLEGSPKIIYSSYYFLNNDVLEIDSSASTVYYFNRKREPNRIVYNTTNGKLDVRFLFNYKDHIIHSTFIDNNVIRDGYMSYYYNRKGKRIKYLSFFNGDTIVWGTHSFNHKQNEEIIHNYKSDSLTSTVLKKYFKNSDSLEVYIYIEENGRFILERKEIYNTNDQLLKIVDFDETENYSYFSYTYNERIDLIRKERFLVNSNGTLLDGVEDRIITYDDFGNIIKEEVMFNGVTSYEYNYHIEYY